MNDWSAEDLAKAIERRRGRPRRATGASRNEKDKPGPAAWTDREWASQFTFLHGHQAKVRGVTQVCVRDDDGETMWEGPVRELTLSAEPWIGYAWMVRVGDSSRYESALQSDVVRSAADAVRARL